jgi:hypothetical protein
VLQELCLTFLPARTVRAPPIGWGIEIVVIAAADFSPGLSVFQRFDR